MKFIIVIIPKFKFYRIIFEDEFIDNNEFRTQNRIIETLKVFGLTTADYICDLCFR